MLFRVRLSFLFEIFDGLIHKLMRLRQDFVVSEKTTPILNNKRLDVIVTNYDKPLEKYLKPGDIEGRTSFTCIRAVSV